MAVNLLVRLAGLREILGGLSAEPFPFQQPHSNTSTTVIQWFYSVFSKVFQQQSRGKEVTMVTRIMEIDGAKLRRLRTRRLWLIGDLAEKSGVHRNLISDYELGKSGAHPDTIRKLADALDVEPVELLKD
jgi:ribosome-binding protein aMBF1 (putative translation factor)